MIFALLLLIGAGEDPRPELIQLQLEGKDRAALEQVEETLAKDAEAADTWGFDYLRGHLLERLDDHQASEAFSKALTATPMLAGYSRYRLALSQMRMGHPEVAAGLLATLLANEPPALLTPTAVRLLSESLSQGGDCRLLSGVDSWRLPKEQSRYIRLSRAICARQSGAFDLATDLATELLKESREDEPARGAAGVVADLVPESATAETLLRVGLTFHAHREFEQAVPFLERGIAALPSGVTVLRNIDREDAKYELARSFFWLGDYSTAAAKFSEVASAERQSSKIARAHFQQGRCWELAGDWLRASAAYRRSLATTPTSNWTPAAYLAATRVDWRSGNETGAIELLDRLLSRSDWKSMAQRGLFFAISSDLVRGRADRADEWLQKAKKMLGSGDQEVLYWGGRLAELEGRGQDAARFYVSILVESAYHPLGVAARKRLGRETLTAASHDLGRELARSNQTKDLYKAWMLLGQNDPDGARAQIAVAQSWGNNSQAKPFLSPQLVPPVDWAIWQSQLNRPEELLLSLGIVEKVSPVVRRTFPQGDTPYALTGSRLLATAGLYQPSLYLAEVAGKRLPEDMPVQLLPVGYRRLLYPRPYQNLVLREATRQNIDPDLLNAIIREESRFDPMAISGASARGLTQFVLPTARSVGDSLGWHDMDAVDLHRPPVAIALGAAYLAKLEALFDGRDEIVTTAYNAGGNQARLWSSYCYSNEPEEYFSKVGFVQTRNYLRKVGTSHAQYKEIYSLSENSPQTD